MKDDALQQLSAAKREAEKLTETAEEEAKKLVEEAKSRAAKTLEISDEDARMTQLAAERERARVISEAESRLSEAKVEIERMRNEAQRRNLDLMTRARNEAQAEAQSLLNDVYDERKTVITRLQGQNERVRQLADESARIRRHLTDLYKDVQLRLNEVITSINEIDERAGSLAEKADAATKNV
jgi:vacuolar-type H+-ATPase subunit H